MTSSLWTSSYCFKLTNNALRMTVIDIDAITDNCSGPRGELVVDASLVLGNLLNVFDVRSSEVY